MTSSCNKLSDIASALALTPRRVQQLVKEGILPVPVSGRYNLVESIQAYKKYLQQRIPKSNSTNSLNTQKLRLLTAQADRAELEVEILDGKYIAATEVELLWSGLLVAFRARMLSLPTNLARQLIAFSGDLAAITHLLEQSIHEALLELSNYKIEHTVNNTRSNNKTPADSKDSSPAAETNG